MFASTRSSPPTRLARLVAIAIPLAVAGVAYARNGGAGPSGGDHVQTGHHASIASSGQPLVVMTKPGDKHHHHVRVRFFDDWYWASACIRYPTRHDDASLRVDWRWHGLARCRFVDETAYYD